MFALCFSHVYVMFVSCLRCVCVAFALFLCCVYIEFEKRFSVVSLFSAILVAFTQCQLTGPMISSPGHQCVEVFEPEETPRHTLRLETRFVQ